MFKSHIGLHRFDGWSQNETGMFGHLVMKAVWQHHVTSLDAFGFDNRLVGKVEKHAEFSAALGTNDCAVTSQMIFAGKTISKNDVKRRSIGWPRWYRPSYSTRRFWLLYLLAAHATATSKLFLVTVVCGRCHQQAGARQDGRKNSYVVDAPRRRCCSLHTLASKKAKTMAPGSNMFCGSLSRSNKNSFQQESKYSKGYHAFFFKRLLELQWSIDTLHLIHLNMYSLNFQVVFSAVCSPLGRNVHDFFT